MNAIFRTYRYPSDYPAFSGRNLTPGDDVEVEPAVEENNNQRKTSFELFQSCPNPIKNVTLIRYQIPKESYVSLCIYDKAGLFINTIVSKNLKHGNYTTTWNGMNSNGIKVPAGTYFYVLKVDNKTLTKKMIMLE